MSMRVIDTYTYIHTQMNIAGAISCERTRVLKVVFERVRSVCMTVCVCAHAGVCAWGGVKVVFERVVDSKLGEESFFSD